MSEKRANRTAVRYKRNAKARLDSFVADYVLHANNDLYNEAKQRYDMLRERYPNKSNLKITKEHIYWKDNTKLSTQQETIQAQSEFADTLELRIPLINNEKEQAGNSTGNGKEQAGNSTGNGKEQAGTSAEDVIPLFEHVIPEEIIENIIKELQANPETNAIFSSLQEELDFQELGMDIEIEDDNLLEKELPLW